MRSLLGGSCVSRLQNAMLSKSSTLTKLVDRTVFELRRIPSYRMSSYVRSYRSGGKMYAFDLESARAHLTSLCLPAKWRDLRISVLLFLDQIKREKGVW